MTSAALSQPLPPPADAPETTAEQVIEWALERFDPSRLALSTAFGPSGVVLAHLASRIAPGVRVFFVDTGLHFAETTAMIERLGQALPVDIQVIEPLITLGEQRDRHGDALWTRDPDACCALRKVEPTRRMLDGLDAWMTGLRRDQGPSRANTPLVSPRPHGERTVYKINPLVRWTRKDVWGHIMAHGLPYNPLHDQGYPSVGCVPCTRAVGAGADERAGRWAGRGKTECGLHTLI